MVASLVLEKCPLNCGCGKLCNDSSKITIIMSIIAKLLVYLFNDILTLSEYRDCSRGTNVLLDIRDCCNLNYPCNQDEGHCDFDHDCKEGLICGKNNCNPKNFPSKGTRCCTKGD